MDKLKRGDVYKEEHRGDRKRRKQDTRNCTKSGVVLRKTRICKAG